MCFNQTDLKTKSSNGGIGSTGETPKVSQAMYGLLNISLPIYSGGRIRYGIESSRFLEQAAKLDAEDDKDDRFFFEKALAEISFNTNLTTVLDGEQLMDYLLKNPEQLPDIIFLDLSMPRKNGFECLAELKENEKCFYELLMG